MISGLRLLHTQCAAGNVSGNSYDINMGNITRKILLLLVIVSILFVAAEGRRRRHHRHCPSRDDEDHVCCEWKRTTLPISFQQCSTCTAPTPENKLCFHDRRFSHQQYYCWFTHVLYVTKIECEAKCCDGWTIDENGQCSVRADEQQDIVCENGGSPAGDYCSCPIGFVGTHCEKAVCTPICLNNGFCGGRDGKAVCICPERNFTGEQCEIPVCDPKCQNGGSCMENGYETKCACMPGFAGQSCEKKIKDGECPYMGEVSTCQVECGDDIQCPGTKKCCINACGGGVCVSPTNTTCTFNGQQYPLGHITIPSPCKTCFCSDPNSQGDKQWRCAVMDCPILTCDHRKTIPDVCCPVCDETPSTTSRPGQTTLSPDNAPFFKHCPKERLTLSTLGRNYVDIRAQVNLTVVDKSGKKYTVKYSQERIAAKPCNCTDNYHIIIARSEVDKHGRFASCMFNVHVFDNNAPVYKTCPTSISAFEDEIITWDRPETYDNVAIKSEKIKSLHKNNSKFKVGSHVVMYILTDHQGNIGICNFLVAIYERGTTDPTAPLELKNDDDKDKSILTNIVIGVLTGLIALTTIVIVLACYRRRRNQNLASGNAHPVSGYDNGIYATPNTPPPSYGRSFGAKLPPKYMVHDDKPPVYEEVDVKALSQKKGVHNPLYDSTDDLDLGRRIRPKLEMKEDAEA